MNSLLVKALLSLSLLGKAPVEPVVVSIDKYQTSNQDSVYLVGEVHIGTDELVRQEHIDFMAAVRSKENAAVIGEDASHYDGDNNKIKKFFDALFRRAIPESAVIYPSALENLTRSCKNYMIPFFNAECRHEVFFECLTSTFNSKDVYDNLAAAIAPSIHDLELYNINWLKFYSWRHISIHKKYLLDDDNIWDSSPEHRKLKIKDFETKAVDIRILQGLHNMLFDAPQQLTDPEPVLSEIDHNRKKNIFVFAGAAHINRIIPTLEKHFKFIASTVDKQREFSRDRFDFFEEIDRGEDQEFIDTYKVNITDFFALEKEQESALSACE